MDGFVKAAAPINRRLMELVIFPIIKALYFPGGVERHHLIGTGFFIGGNGEFATARHVFQGPRSAFDLEGASGFAVYCVHSVHISGKPVARHIDVRSVRVRNDTDMAVGRVELKQFGRGDDRISESELSKTSHIPRLSSKPVPVGAKIWTVAYPLATLDQQDGKVHIHSQSDLFQGQITKSHPNGRDRGLLPWPCYETDMQILAGASGGPVILAGTGGVAIGVNCTGTDPHVVSHVSSFAPIAREVVANKPNAIELP